MSGGADAVRQIQQSRTSVIAFLFGVGSLYYSTQIQLNHGFVWWNVFIIVFGIISMIMAVQLLIEDRDHERTMREHREDAKELDISTKEIMNEKVSADEDLEPSEVAETRPLNESMDPPGRNR